VAVTIEAEGDLVRLSVSDDGGGFSQAEREQRVAEGHIGLTLLQELAERHGGTLRIASAAGGGTSFVLEVPTQ
jgi:two-component system NarL family sensor kinase